MTDPRGKEPYDLSRAAASEPSARGPKAPRLRPHPANGTRRPRRARRTDFIAASALGARAAFLRAN